VTRIEQRRRGGRAKEKGAYHHGDLRRALIAAAEDVIAEAGVPGLTLRNVGRRLGVSHAAPAHHFGDKEGLLVALAEDGFGLLEAHMRNAAKAASSPLARLKCYGVAYVEFAVKHPSHFRVMFDLEVVQSSHVLALQSAAGPTLTLLLGAIEEGQKSGEIRPSPPAELAAVAWSLVHGLSALAIAHQFAKRTLVDADPLALAEAATTALYLGLRL
jgi:AcrR family transcriptional regulator